VGGAMTRPLMWCSAQQIVRVRGEQESDRRIMYKKGGQSFDLPPVFIACVSCSCALALRDFNRDGGGFSAADAQTGDATIFCR